jgi:hypothetical protein
MKSEKAHGPVFFLFVALGIFLFGFLLYKWYPTPQIHRSTANLTDREILKTDNVVVTREADLDNKHKFWVIIDGSSMNAENEKRYLGDHAGDRIWNIGRLPEEKRIYIFTDSPPKSKRDIGKYLD